MSGFSISGLISNINTSALVQQMMQINQIPQQLLINQQTAAKTALKAYQNINSRFQALQTAARALSDPGMMNATTATSSEATVVAATTTGAQAGSMTFQVKNPAQAATSISTARWGATTDALGLTTPIAIYDTNGNQVGSVAVTGQGGNPPTLGDAVTALNSATYQANGQTYHLSAATVQVAPGQYALQVSAGTSGKDANFTLGAAGQFSQVTAGVDATLQVGSGAGAYTVTSSTNTFTGLMPGVNVSVSQATPLNQNVTVTVGTDVDGLTKKMQALVDATNAAYNEIRTDTDTSGAATTSGGSSTVTAPLPNDFPMQDLAQKLLHTIGDVITTASGSNGTAAELGISTDRDGTITFDQNAFKVALQTDPARVTALVQGTAGSTGNPGLAMKLATSAAAATDPAIGSITTMITSENSQISDLGDSIDAWNLRLADMQANLTNQFNAMETLLGQLQSQQQWMTAMFASSFGGSNSSSSGGSKGSVSQN